MYRNSITRAQRALMLMMIGLFILPGALMAKERGATSSLAKALKRDSGVFDGNRIFNDLENNGMIVSHRITGHSGMEWPKGSGLFIDFASGIWIAGKVGSDIRTAVGEFSPEFVPGPWGSNSGDAEHQLYIVYKADLADPLGSDDFQNWPVHLGAPWVDEDGDGLYNPMPLGPDHPEFIGDQVIWYVINDGDVFEHGAVFKSLPLGVEVQMTIWGYDRPDAFGDMMFVKVLIINKGGNRIDDCYIGLWNDPDLGDAGDDFVGCDTTLSLGYVYNDGQDADYGQRTPALGFDFFQGPIVASPGDTAFAYGRFHPGFKNLPMSSFSKYINTDDPLWSDPNTAAEAYNLMQGFTKFGDPFIDPDGNATKFIHAGDPVTEEGWIDKQSHASGDRRYLMNSGPFTLAQGDSQEVVYGVIIAQAGDYLSSITLLKEVDALAQLAYDIQFALPESPSAPNVSVTPLKESIVLNWDDGVNAVESYEAIDVIDKLPVPIAFDTTYTTDIDFSIEYDTTIVGTDTTITVDTTFFFVQVIGKIDTTFQGQDTKFNFQGYNVYQFETATGQGRVKRLATYDLVDGIEEIFDVVFDPTRGENVTIRVRFGSDSGIRRSFFIDNDALGGGIPLKTNRAYYFAVTAYGYNPYGIPRTLESPFRILTIQPQVPRTLDPVAEPTVDGILASHTAGGSDGSVAATVIDPLALTGDNYQVSFRFNSDSSAVVWDLTNTTTNTLLVSGNPIQSGVDSETGKTVNEGASPIIDGIQIIVNGPSNGIHGIWQVANANGPIAGVDEDVNENIHWINFLTAPDFPTQQAQGGWVFVTHGGGSANDIESFYSRVFRGTNFSRAIPNDLEMRFTADALANGRGYLRFTGPELIIPVPFELWNMGPDPDDTSDDYRMCPAILSVTSDDTKWNFGGDDPSSGAENDPSSDWVYWGNPDDTSPGETGYNAFFTPGVGNAPTLGWTEVLARTRIMNWNRFLGGGDILDGGGPLDSAAAELARPEVGTIIRWITNKPNALNDVFAFSTGDLKAATLAISMDAINVWPNPYFAYNPEERTPVERMMQFTHLPPNATIRIFNLAGQLVKKIDHTDGTQFETWNLTNNFNIPVASGMYIASIESEHGNKILKLAVIQAEQRIDVY